MECPDALRNYVGQRLEQSLHLASIGTNRLSFCLDSFLTELILLGLEHNHEPKDYRRWIAQCGEIISKCVLQYPDVGDRVRSNEMKPLDVLNFWNEMKERNEKVFQDITSHHQLLIYHGWDYLSFTETTTKLYSIAASEMGKRPWVRDINEWMASQILKFFRQGGARKHFLKTYQGCELSSDLVCNLFPEKKISVLDVGSCYNYFQQSPNADYFSVTAIDLCPADTSVYCGDFLSINIGEAFVTDPEGPGLTNSKVRILEFPSNFFDAITLSLVLSYLPSFHERETMIRNARLLLRRSAANSTNPHHQGLLIIAEKASIFSNRNDSSDITFPSAQQWIDAICSIGFTLVCYQSPVLSRHKVHLFVFSVADHTSLSESKLRIRKEGMIYKQIDDG